MVTEDHVDVALEGTKPFANDPPSMLHRAAAALFDAASREGSLTVYKPILDRKGLLFDMVWFVAVQAIGDSMLGNREARSVVAAMLDKEKSVAQNNYGSELKKTCRRLAAFYADHAQEPPLELKRILGIEDDET